MAASSSEPRALYISIDDVYVYIQLRVYVSMYLFTQLSLTALALHSPTQPPRPPTCYSRVFQFVCSLEIAFLCILSNEFSTSLTGLIWNLFAAAASLSLIYTHYVCFFLHLLSLSFSLLPAGTKILISSPTNFVIARCERALNLNWIFAHIKMHLHRVSYECIWEKRHGQ